MRTHTVAVEYTDRTRDAEGRFNIRHTWVQVAASTKDIAACVAAQIVASTRPEDFMVTASRVVRCR